MRLLFEEYQYAEKAVHPYLQSLEHLNAKVAGNKIRFDCVGYFFCKDVQDVVFVLPKVLIKGDGERQLAFGQFAPEELIDFDKNAVTLLQAQKEFISRLAVWLYRAIYHYSQRQMKNESVVSAYITDLLRTNAPTDLRSRTYLDIILQLFRFHKEHSQLFTLVSLAHSGGVNQVNWNRTVNKTNPLIADGIPIYTKLETKKKKVNFEDALISLFYSVLIFLKGEYCFDVRMLLNYPLTKPAEIEAMIKTGKGTRMLRSIRRNYFKDELVSLWKLLYIFFDKAERIATGRYNYEKLLVRNFNNIFEDMIDCLLSDSEQTVPKGLKEQHDGKLVDHIYSDKSLVGPEEIYYIGDSKYYQEKNLVGKPSVYKQFTYAKNVIQYNVGIFDGARESDAIKRYRDSITEGYDITPNFFIRGTIDFGNLSGNGDGLENIEGEKHTMSQFNDRLFDRDTLLIETYNINFLYVLNAYIRRSDDRSFREKARKTFREDILARLNERYDFFKMSFESRDQLESFVSQYFKRMIGRMFRIKDDSTDILVAFEKDIVNEKDAQIQKELKQELTQKGMKETNIPC